MTVLFGLCSVQYILTNIDGLIKYFVLQLYLTLAANIEKYEHSLLKN
jgi:hypothetical protein